MAAERLEPVVEDEGDRRCERWPVASGACSREELTGREVLSREFHANAPVLVSESIIRSAVERLPYGTAADWLTLAEGFEKSKVLMCCCVLRGCCVD